MTRHLPEQTRRSQILEAARKLFVERGYGPTKMSDIATEAQLSKGGVYFHFVSKEEVFAALVEDEFNRSMGFIRDMSGPNAIGPDTIAQLAQHFYQRFYGENDTARFFVVMAEMALRHEPVRQRLTELQKAYWDAIAEVVEGGIRSGFLRPVNAKCAAVILKAIMDGIEAMAAFDPDRSLKQQFDFEGLLDVAMRGILKDPA